MTTSNRTRNTIGAVLAAGAPWPASSGPATAQAEPQGHDGGAAGVALVYGTFNPPGGGAGDRRPVPSDRVGVRCVRSACGR